MDVKQHGTRGVGVIGHMDTALSHFPDKPRINRTKQQFTTTRTLARAFHMVEDPLHFGAREVRVNHQTGVVTNVLFHAIAFEMLADLGGTTALPDNGVIDRLAGFFFPDNSGFTLVRNTDSCNLIGTDIGFRQHFYQRGALGGPDFHWVVFYPAWFWVDLLKFALRHANDIGIVIHYDRAGAGGALVERNDIFFFSHV